MFLCNLQQSMIKLTINANNSHYHHQPWCTNSRIRFLNTAAEYEGTGIYTISVVLSLCKTLHKENLLQDKYIKQIK